MKKTLNLTSHKNIFSWAIILFSVFLFSSFYHSAFSESHRGLSDSNDPITFFYQGKAERFKVVPDQSNYSVSFCDLTPNQEYEVRVNFFEPAMNNNCESVIKNSLTSEENKKIKFIPTTSCYHLEVQHICPTEKLGMVVFSFKEIKKGTPKINTPSNDDQPEVMALQTMGSGAFGAVDKFIGADCFDVTNISQIGGAQGIGLFSNGTSSIGFEEGVILASGNIFNAQGPNNSEEVSGGTGGGSDADLVALSGNSIIETAGIEFDFTPTIDQVSFSFVFASEEYCEWINSPYNDAFGFFISGPGISGPFSGGAENIAVVPGSTQPITISTINNTAAGGFFIPNNTSCGVPTGNVNNNIQYDGYTTPLTAVANVIACETYHIKLVIGDATDDFLDSAVFLNAGSFSAGGLAGGEAVFPSTGSNLAFEGCSDGSIIISREGGDILQPLTVPISISPLSTATEGVDFLQLPSVITIPPGQVQVEIPIFVLTDNLLEGLETLIVELGNACSCTTSDVTIFIDDSVPLEAEMQGIPLCLGGTANLSPTVTGGAGQYTYMWSNGMMTPAISEVITQTTTFVVTVSDGCQSTVASATVDLTSTSTASIIGVAQLCPPTVPTGSLTIVLTGNPPWTVYPLIDGVAQPPIQNIMTSPYTLIVTEVGTYTLSQVESNGCPGNVGSTPGLVINTPVGGEVMVTDVSCEGQADGAIDLNPNSGQGPWSYNWSNGPVTQDLASVSPGTYTVTITDANGCLSDPIEVTVNDGASISISGTELTGATCDSPTGGSIDLTVNGTGSSYTYNWDNGAPAVEDPTGLAAGVYNVTVTADGNCTAVTSVTISDNTNIPTAIVNNNLPSLSCDNLSISLDGNGSSTGNFSYLWMTSNGNIVSGETTLNPNVNAAGDYQLLVIDNSNGCEAIATVSVTGSTEMPVAVAGNGQALDCTNSSLILSGDGSSTNNVSYLWTTSNGNIVSGNTTLNPTINAPGMYTLQVTNNISQCVQSSTVTISENQALPVAVVGVASTLDCNNNTISLNGNGSSSGSNFIYQWTTTDGTITGGETTLTPSVNTAGTYQLQITDTSNGCTNTASVTVTSDINEPTATIANTSNLTCMMNSLSLDGSGSSAGTYSWTTNDGNIVSGNTTLNPTIDLPGTYQLQVTASNGCTATFSMTVGENTSEPNADAGATSLIGCSTPTISLDGSNSSMGGNFSYLWTTSNGNITSGNTTLNPSIDATGTYILVVTDDNNGCTAESSVIVSGSTDLPNADAGIATNLTCNITELSLDGTNSDMSSGTTYSWTTNDGNIVSGNTTLNPTIDLPGIYQLEVTGANGCVATSTVTIGDNSVDPIAMALAPSPTIDCGTPSVSLDGNGSASGNGITYLWTTGDGNIISGNTTLNPEINAAGTYELLVTDSNTGCTATASVSIDENNNSPTVTIATANDLTCTVMDLSLDGTGSSTGDYEWTTGDGNIVSGNTTLNPTIDLPGTYVLQVTGSNGCTSTSSITIGENISTPIANAGTADPFGCTTSSVSLNGTGSSTGNHSYLWTTSNGSITSGETSLMPTVGAAGIYTLEVTDNTTGCTNTESVTVEASTDLPTADAGVVDDFTCLVTDFTLDGSGSDTGTGITYQWTSTDGTILSGESTLTPMVTGVGTYELLVTNSNTGCTAISTVSVIDNTTPPTVGFEAVPILSCTQTTGSLSGNASSLGSEFSYEWTTTNGNILSGETTLNPEINAAGMYQLLITNTITGCTAMDEIEVAESNDLPTVEANVTDDITCNILEVSLDGTGSSSGNDFTYLWTTTDGNILSGETTLNPIVDAGGTYLLQVTNSINGCTNISSVIVETSNDSPTVDAGIISTINCDNPTISLDGSGSSTGFEFEYLWTTTDGNILSGETSLTPEVDLAGVYTLTINNTLTGCSDVTSITVTGNSTEPIAFINIADPITCTQTTTSLSGVGSSTGTDFTYEWTTTNGNILSGETTLEPVVNAAGMYELVITNTQTGCTNSETVEVTLDGDVPEANAGDNGLLNCNITNTTLNGSGATGTDITYLWTTSDGSIVSGETTLSPEVDAAGTYQLTVSNAANGCSNISTVLVELDDTAPNVNAGVAASISCTSTVVELDGSASSSGNHTYLWTTTNGNILSGETTLNPEVNATGIYQLTVTSLDNGCTEVAEVEVTQDSSLPTADAGDAFEITCEVFGGTLDGTASSIGTDITYLWTTTDGNIVSGETSLTPEIDAAGVYQLLLTDGSNGCTAISSVNIIENNTPPNADAGLTQELNCINPTLVIDGTNSETGTDISYLWTTSNGTIFSGENTLTPEITSEGTYDLLVTNSTSGCTSMSSVIITESFEAPQIVILPPAELNCTANVTSLDGTGSSIGTNFTYLWSTTDGNITSGETTLEPQVDAAGDYELLITNTSNGCTQTESITVIQNGDLPNAEAVVMSDLTCAVTEITLSGGNTSTGSDFEYMWTTINGNILLGNTTLTPTVDEPGDYILTVTNIQNNCTATSQITVVETITEPTAIAGSDGLLTCTVSETQLDGNGSSAGSEFVYEWTTINGTIISGETTLTPLVGAVGAYELLVTNTTTGCTSTSSVDVNSNGDLPDAVAMTEGMLTCTTASVGLNGIGSATGMDFSYQWTTNDGNILSGGTTLNPVVDAIGTYILQVTNNSNGCTSQVSTIVEDDTNAPSAMIDQNASLLLDCTTSSLVLDGSGSTPIGNVSYQWTTMNGNILSGANTPNPEVNAQGTYTLLVTDLNNGCTHEVEVEVTQDLSIPTINIATPQTLTCDLNQIDLSATNPSTGDYDYQWTTQNGNILSGGNTLTPTINQSGNYILTVIDLSNNCETISSIMVAEDTDAPTAEAGTADMLDCVITSVGLNGDGSSVGNNISYEWTTINGNVIGNNNTLAITVDAVGTYNLMVTDTNNGCTATDVVTVEQDDSVPTGITYSIDIPECEEPQGDIIIETVDGGTPPYLYSVDGENFYNGHIFTLAGGDYILYAQDANGCEVQTSFSIPIVDPINVAVTPEANIDLGEDYSIEALTNIPMSEIESISWSPVNNLSCTDCLNPTVEQLFENATYTITITNIYGCKTSASINIVVEKDRAIYLPNVFTPNGDGNNDFFMIYAGVNAQIVSIKNFHVFDRWGEVVHTATDFLPNDSAYGWDGTLRGQKMNPAVFVYWFEVEFLDGETVIYEGDVALRRH